MGRSSILLWQIAILLRGDKLTEAKPYADQLLLIDPDLSVPLDVFEPSIAEYVEEARKQTFTVCLQGVPTGASITIGGVEAGSRFRVAPGRRQVLINLATFGATEENLDVAET